MVLLHRLLSSAREHSYFFFPRLSDSPSPRLLSFALNLSARTRECVCVGVCVRLRSCVRARAE